MTDGQQANLHGPLELLNLKTDQGGLSNTTTHPGTRYSQLASLSLIAAKSVCWPGYPLLRLCRGRRSRPSPNDASTVMVANLT